MSQNKSMWAIGRSLYVFIPYKRGNRWTYWGNHVGAGDGKPENLIELLSHLLRRIVFSRAFENLYRWR